MLSPRCLLLPRLIFSNKYNTITFKTHIFCISFYEGAEDFLFFGVNISIADDDCRFGRDFALDMVCFSV